MPLDESTIARTFAPEASTRSIVRSPVALFRAAPFCVATTATSRPSVASPSPDPAIDERFRQDAGAQAVTPPAAGRTSS